jgi:hypothetical protein
VEISGTRFLFSTTCFLVKCLAEQIADPFKVVSLRYMNGEEVHSVVLRPVCVSTYPRCLKTALLLEESPSLLCSGRPLSEVLL